MHPPKNQLLKLLRTRSSVESRLSLINGIAGKYASFERYEANSYKTKNKGNNKSCLDEIDLFMFLILCAKCWQL
jgi:hypothetical protein